MKNLVKLLEMLDKEFTQGHVTIYRRGNGMLVIEIPLSYARGRERVIVDPGKCPTDPEELAKGIIAAVRKPR